MTERCVSTIHWFDCDLTVRCVRPLGHEDERHAFEPGEARGHYCQRCELPRTNRRHLPEPPPGDAA